MANTEEVVTRVFLDVKDAQNKLQALMHDADELKKRQKEAFIAGDQKTYREATKELKKVNAEIKALSTSSQAINNTLKNLSTASVKELNSTIKAINAKLRDGSVQRNSAEWKELQTQLKKAKAEMQSINEEAQVQKSWWDKLVTSLNNNWGAIFQLIYGYDQFRGFINGCTQAFADYEEAIANVSRYTGQSSEEVREMNEDLKKMDTRTSIEQLDELASAAGRLGISNKESIEEFVDGADKIAIALGDDLGDGAVDTIGKLAMAFGEDDRMGLRGAMLATGSAVNELAANSSANAGYLVEFTSRLSGIGLQAGMTQAQIMGLGAVMDENMQQDEMASTAISQLLSKFATDTDKFAKMAGLSITEFTNLVKTDMNQALLTFLDAMSSKGGFTQLAPMFGEMQLDGVRATQVLSVLAEKVDDVRKYQELANNAYKEGTSVIKEYNVQNNTPQAKLDKAKKDLNNITVKLGQQLIPIAKTAISTTNMGVRSLSTLITFLMNHKTVVLSLITSITAYTAVTKASIMVDKIKVLWTGYIVTGLKTLYTTLMKNPYFAVTAAIFTLIAAYKDWRSSINEVSASERALQEVNRQAASDAETERENINVLINAAQNKAESDAVRKKAIEELNRISPEYLGNLTKENINTEGARKAIDSYTKSILLNAKAKRLAAEIDNVTEQKENARKEDYTRWYDGLQTGLNSVGRLLEKTRNGVQTLFSVGSFSSGWNEKTFIDSEGYATTTAQAAFIREKNTINELSKTEIRLKDELKKTNEELLKNKAEVGRNFGANEKNESGDFMNAKKQKEQEKQRKETERKRKTALKKELDELKKNTDTQMTELANSYSKGEIKYSEFIDKRANITKDGYRKQMDALHKYGEGESAEYDNLAAKMEEAERVRQNKKRQLLVQELEKQKAATEASINSQYMDSNSNIYQDEYAKEEALFQNEMNFLLKKRELYLASSDEYAQISEDIEVKQQEHQFKLKEDYEKKAAEMRRNYMAMEDEERLVMEQKALDTLHNKGLVSEEEYQKMLLAIRNRYTTSDSTNGMDKDTENALSLAKKGVKGRPKTDSYNNDSTGLLSIFGISQEVQYREEVNRELERLYQEDVITEQTYNDAKKQNLQEMYDEVLQMASAAYSGIGNLVSAASAYSQACSDLEVAKITANYDKQIESAGNNSRKRQQLEEKRDKEIAEAKTKANKKAMTIEVAQALAGTAMAAINAYASAAKISFVLGPIAAAAATAAGLLQVATIKKQHEAQQAGFYEGGFTGSGNYKKEAGVVHAGEFVANHYAVRNPNLLPALQLIDLAQRNNTVSSLSAEDISRAVGISAGTSFITPVVNVTTDNEDLNRTISNLSSIIVSLNSILTKGIRSTVVLDGQDGLDAQYRKFKRLKN